MRCWGSHSSGRVQVGEADKIYVPYGWKYDQSKRVIIWLHGSGSDYRPGPLEKGIMDVLDVPWVCALLGGVDTWQGDTVMSRITAAFNWAKTNLGVKQDKCILWGGSMGGGNALQYAIENPGNVAAVGCAIPALDSEYVRANDVGGRKAAIEAVHGVGPVPTNKRPGERGADWNHAIPLKLWYSTSDPYTPQASTETFIAASGGQAVSMGAIGHSYVPIYLDPAVSAFLNQYLA